MLISFIGYHKYNENKIKTGVALYLILLSSTIFSVNGWGQRWG